MESQYNMRSPAVRRLMKEAQELSIPTAEYFAQPIEDNLFEWHFTVRGPAESDFDGGVYHGRIILPPEYPMKPPSIILLNSNGRFEINKKICLSISGHHPESWQPSWSIRTALLALIGFMPTHGGGAIGSLDYTADERIQLAKKSQSWVCSVCGPLETLLSERAVGSGPTLASQEAKELAAQISFKGVQQETGSSNPPSNSNPNAITTAESHVSQDDNLPQLRSRNRNFVRDENNVEYASILEQDVTVSSGSSFSPFYTLLLWILTAAIAALLLRRLFFL